MLIVTKKNQNVLQPFAIAIDCDGFQTYMQISLVLFVREPNSVSSWRT